MSCPIDDAVRREDELRRAYSMGLLPGSLTRFTTDELNLINDEIAGIAHRAPARIIIESGQPFQMIIMALMLLSIRWETIDVVV